MNTLFSRQLVAARVSLLAIALICNAASATETLSDNAPSSLSSFVKDSLNQQPRLLAVQASIAAAEANLRASKQAIYNPELELAYEDAGDRTTTIGVNQTIDWGGQKEGRSAVASAELVKNKNQYVISAQSFVADLLMGLAQNQTAKQLASLNSETLQLMAEFKGVAKQRHQAGDLNQIDLNLAHLAYNQVLMEQAKILSNVTQANEHLRAIIGTFPTVLPVLPEQFPEPLLPDNLESFLMELPNIRASLAEVQSNKHQITLRRSEQAWDPTIGITAGTEGSDNLIGLNFSIPLKVRNDFSAEVDVAYQEMIASEQRAQQNYRDTQAKLMSTTERYRNLLTAWNNWRQNSRNSVDQQLVLINTLWQAGDISATDYLLQIKQVLEIQVTGYELRNELWNTAFEWLTITANMDKWLNINLQEIN
jgi:cobalt-zinc-cadmium efflux system outer membrane protein